MTSDPLTVDPDTGIADAAQLMENRKIGGLPVVDDGVLVGIITISDLMNYLIRRLEEDRL